MVAGASTDGHWNSGHTRWDAASVELCRRFEDRQLGHFGQMADFERTD